METSSKCLIEYFVDNILDELADLAKFEAKDTSAHRGAKIFNDYDEEGREYGIKFLGLLGECFKYWGTQLDENIPGVKKIQEDFYELLDLGAVQFSDSNKYYDIDIVKSGELSGSNLNRVETEEDLFDGYDGDVGHEALPAVQKLGNFFSEN